MILLMACDITIAVSVREPAASAVTMVVAVAASASTYGDETDNNIRDAILWKCPSSYIKRRLLEEGDELTLIRTL